MKVKDLPDMGVTNAKGFVIADIARVGEEMEEPGLCRLKPCC